MKEPLDQLRKIKQVEASPFLLTRINQQIREMQNQQVGKIWYQGALMALAIIFCLNLLAIRNYVVINKINSQQLEGVFNVSGNNLSIYE